MRRRVRRLLLSASSMFALAAAGPEGGSFEGEWRAAPGGEPHAVSFSFHREREGAGRITVELPTGGVFAGEYLRLSSDQKPSRIQSIFSNWSREGFDRFDRGPAGQPWSRAESTEDTFRRKHRDRVVATLINAGRVTMRCSFALARPSVGLPGGASGACQLTDGGVIDVAMPAPRIKPKESGEGTESETAEEFPGDAVR